MTGYDYNEDRYPGRDSSLDVDDCAESRAERFAPAPMRNWPAARLAEWQALQFSTSKGGSMRPESESGATDTKAAARRLLDAGRPI